MLKKHINHKDSYLLSIETVCILVGEHPRTFSKLLTIPTRQMNVYSLNHVSFSEISQIFEKESFSFHFLSIVGISLVFVISLNKIEM